MKRILPFLLVPFLSFAEGEYHALSRQEFVDTVNSINTTLNSVENVLTYESTHIENTVNSNWANIEQSYWNSNDQDVQQILRDVRRWIIQPLQGESLTIQQQALRLSAIQTNLLALAYTPIPDYVPWLDAVTNQLERLCDLQDLTDDHVMTNTAVMAANFNAAQTTLESILSILQQMNGGSSGGGSSDSPDYTSQLNTIISTLSSISSSVASTAAKVNALYDLLTDTDGIFQKYFNLAYDRLEKPDSMLSTDLSQMWEYTVLQMSNVVKRAEDFSLSQQVSPVLSSVDGINLHLSNEGLINLEQLAFQQRQYLCSLEMLNIMRGQTNGSDVAWITNYLDKVQSPYYQVFNRYLDAFHYDNNIWSEPWPALTNFFNGVNHSRVRLNTSYVNFRKAYTNYFQRLEFHLMNLAGMFSQDDLMTDQVETLQDEENVTRNIDYTTNSVIDIQANYANVSNTLALIMASFKDLTDAFDIGGGPDAFANIRILPSFTLGGIQIEHIDLVYADYAFIADGCRYVFTCIWYLIFGIIGFKMVLAVIFLFGRTIAHVILIVSTLLN